MSASVYMSPRTNRNEKIAATDDALSAATIPDLRIHPFSSVAPSGRNRGQMADGNGRRLCVINPVVLAGQAGARRMCGAQAGWRTDQQSMSPHSGRLRERLIGG